MTCCTADPLRPALGAADPRKHVNYVLGMVLGVDDLTQEFTYADNRTRAAVRELIGYGTDRGLAVSIEPSGRGARARITGGVAYTPSGQMVSVDGDQCCTLNDWLAGQGEELALRLGAVSSGTVRVAVTLCYRPCLTDAAPIPGDPCRSEDALMAPSRVKDEFTLDLRFAAPLQTEENAVRELVRWLRAIPTREDSLPDSVEDIIAALRAAASPWLAIASPVDLSTPIASPPAFDLGDPPAGLAIPADDCGEYLRALFRVWTTELRPAWIARFEAGHVGCGCAADCDCAPAEDCVLLAELAIPVLLDSPGVWVVSDTSPVEIDQSRRPFLLHMRMLQEWLLTNCACVAGEAGPAAPVILPDLGGDLSGPIANGVIETIQGVPIAAAGASEQQVMTFVGGTWRPANGPIIPTSLLGDARGSLSATVVAALQGTPVAALAPALDQVLTFDGANWTPKTLPAAPTPTPTPTPVSLAGDVTGAAGATTLSAIRGRPVGAQAPAAGEVLAFDGTNWRPQAMSAPPPAIPPLGGDAVGQIGGNVVAGIHSTPVNAPSGADVGSALVYGGAAWALERMQPAGQYVQYPQAEKGYVLVAAGRFGFQIERRAVIVRPFAYGGGGLPERPFNDLQYVRDNGILLPWQVEFTFADYKDWLHKGVLVVKATAGWLFEPKDPFPRKFPEASTKSPFQVMFSAYNEETFTLVVPPSASLETMQSIVAGEIQIEVSWYPG